MTKKQPTPPPVIVKGYKGFGPDLKCRDHQYEEGQTYEMDSASLCDHGFHFCLNPMDVFNYYPFDTKNVFHEVEAENPNDEESGDSKRVSKKLKIGVSLSLPGIIKAFFDFCRLETEGSAKPETASGDYSRLAASGYSSQLAASGYSSQVSVEGGNSIAVAVGLKSRAKGSLGSWLGLAEYDDEGEIINAKFVKVDGKKIKPGTYYLLQNGKFVEAD